MNTSSHNLVFRGKPCGHSKVSVLLAFYVLWQPAGLVTDLETLFNSDEVTFVPSHHSSLLHHQHK